MASDNKKVYVVAQPKQPTEPPQSKQRTQAPQPAQPRQPEQPMRVTINSAVDPAYKVRKSRSALPSKINPSEAMRGIVLAEVLGLPLSKRGRGRRWS
jgi:hypothetical protein